MKYRGKIKFFDEKKNNFGYIEDISTIDGEKMPRDVYFHGDDVYTNKLIIFPGSEVFFEIVSEGGKEKAVMLKLRHDLTTEEKTSILYEIRKDHLFNLAIDIIKEKIPITAEQSDYLGNNSIDLKSPQFSLDTWAIINNFCGDLQRKEFINRLASQPDIVMIDFINKDFPHSHDLLKKWSFSDIELTRRLLQKINEEGFEAKVNDDFIKKFEENLQSFDIEIIELFYRVFKRNNIFIKYVLAQEILSHKLLKKVTKVVSKYCSKEEMTIFLTNIVINKDKKTFNLEYIVALSIYKNLINNYAQTQLLESLFNFIIHHTYDSFDEMLDTLDIIDLFEQTKKEGIKKHLIKNIKSINNRMDDAQRFKWLELTKNVDILDTWENEFDWYNGRLLDFILKDRNTLNSYANLSNLVISLLHHERKKSHSETTLSSMNSKSNLEQILNYISVYRDKAVLKELIENYLFSGKELIQLFIKYSSNEVFSKLLKDLSSYSNEGHLKSKIELLFFLTSNNMISEKTLSEIPLFIKSELGQLIISKIGYLVYKKLWTGEKALKIISDIKFKDLSTLIMKHWIIKKPNDKNEALNLLSNLFHKQLMLLNENFNENYEIFDDLFSIKSLVKICNGRKYYFKNHWQKDNTERDYVESQKYSVGEMLDLYCEGRELRNETLYSSETKKAFEAKVYWCREGICYGVNELPELDLPFEEWTLIELSEVFNFNIHPLVRSTIAGWINRMNEILEKLKCRKCNSILRPEPFDPIILGYYAVPYFYCINTDCENYKRRIRFTHCLNCGEVIDSRDSEKCSNNWLICTKCGTCCPKHFPKHKYDPKRVSN